jgi:hypothetical protein
VQQARYFLTAEHDRQPLGRLGDDIALDRLRPPEGDAEDKTQGSRNLVIPHSPDEAAILSAAASI